VNIVASVAVEVCDGGHWLDVMKKVSLVGMEFQ
jgi:hypothetical protein